MATGAMGAGLGRARGFRGLRGAFRLDAARRITYTPSMVSMEALRARQPRELLQTDVFRTRVSQGQKAKRPEVLKVALGGFPLSLLTTKPGRQQFSGGITFFKYIFLSLYHVALSWRVVCGLGGPSRGIGSGRCRRRT